MTDEKEDILKVTVCEPSRSRKRRFEAISSESVAECKDDGDRLSDLEPLIKRIKLSECSENDDCRAIETTAFTLNDDVESELIPKRIEFAEYRDDTVLAALCRNDRSFDIEIAFFCIFEWFQSVAFNLLSARNVTGTVTHYVLWNELCIYFDSVFFVSIHHSVCCSECR